MKSFGNPTLIGYRYKLFIMDTHFSMSRRKKRLMLESLELVENIKFSVIKDNLKIINCNINMRIYISRHGESVNNVKNIIGGDCHLTKRGEKFGESLGSYFKHTPLLTVWTSKLIRTIETGVKITNSKFKQWEELNEINSGEFDGLYLKHIQNMYPDEYNRRNRDKLNERYPCGENYKDLQKRVYKVLNTIDLTQEGTLLIISHRAVSRVIYAYFTQTPIDTSLEIKLNTIYELINGRFFPINFDL